MYLVFFQPSKTRIASSMLRIPWTGVLPRWFRSPRVRGSAWWLQNIALSRAMVAVGMPDSFLHCDPCISCGFCSFCCFCVFGSFCCCCCCGCWLLVVGGYLLVVVVLYVVLLVVVVVCGWWLVVGGWLLVVSGWWLVVMPIVVSGHPPHSDQIRFAWQ